MKIYVGNLAYRTTEDDLRGAFEPFGTVASADVISDRATGRSKGFGFVEMPQAEEAKKAIESLDNTELCERTIRVNEARARQPQQGGGGGNRRYGGGDRGGDRGPRRY
ncbi:MAG: RNA-binding protein [Planctomycetia bacterium]|nr:RNA-binding protein [Planctomycetia bacterium]